MGASWDVLGYLGTSRGVLGMSWGVLGASWGRLVRFWGHLGSLLGGTRGLGPFWGHLGTSRMRLGGVFRLSWGCLGAAWKHVVLQNVRRASAGCFVTSDMSNTIAQKQSCNMACYTTPKPAFATYLLYRQSSIQLIGLSQPQLFRSACHLSHP